MTEQEWLASDDPRAMLRLLQWGHQRKKPLPPISDRKLRLFACACCWGVSAELGQDAEQIVEWNSDRARDPKGWAMAWAGDQKKPTQAERAALLRDIVGNPFRPVNLDARLRTPTVRSLAEAAYEERGRRCQADWWSMDEPGGLRQHPVECECHGAGRIDDGTLCGQRLAVLSDALEEAGCESEPILEHLRGWEYAVEPLDEPGVMGVLLKKTDRPHVRGCWALDLILGK